MSALSSARRRPLGESVEIQEDDGRRVQREELAERQTAYDSVAERLPDFRTGAGAEHERHRT